MDLATLQTTLSTLVPLVISVVLLWLALYIFSRWRGDRALRLLALAVGLACLYFLQVGLGRTAYSLEAAVMWSRLLWPAVPFAPVVWLNTVLELGQGEAIPLRWRRSVYVALYLLAGCLAAAGSLTEWLFLYSKIGWAAVPWQVFDLPSADGYYAMPVFLGVVLGAAAWRLIAMPRQVGSSARRQFRRLAVGTVVTAVGAVSLSLDQLLRTPWPEWSGETVMAFGILLVGYAAVSYRTTLPIRRDFSYTAIRTAVVSVLYLIAAVVGWLFQRPLSWALPFVALLVLVVVTHTVYDIAARWFDRVLRVPPALRQERERSRRFYRSLLLDGQPPFDVRALTDEELYQVLRPAVSHVKDLNALVRSRLAHLYSVAVRLVGRQLDPAPSNRALILQQLLTELLKGLRMEPLGGEKKPEDAVAADIRNPCFSTLWYKYVEEPPPAIAKWLDAMPKRTMHHWQEKGCRAMMATLRYREDQARVTLLGEERAETGGPPADEDSDKP